MAYHELRCELPSRPVLRIGGSDASATDYDVDGCGQDDGTDPNPDAAFRLMFPLGSGWEIHLYVVGMARPNDARAFHSFWLRDCAVYHVDPVEYGAERFVSCPPTELLPVYASVSIESSRGTSRYAVDRFTFESRPTLVPEPDLVARWHVRDRERARSTLVYASRAGWRWESASGVRALEPDERITFAEPNRPPSEWSTHPPPYLTWRAARWDGDPREGFLVANVDDLLDHAFAISTIRKGLLWLGDESTTITFAPDLRHVLTTRAVVYEAYGSSGNDGYGRFFEVWNVATRERVLVEQHEYGLVDGTIAGTSAARFTNDGRALELLSGERVAHVRPLAD